MVKQTPNARTDSLGRFKTIIHRGESILCTSTDFRVCLFGQGKDLLSIEKALK